MWLINVTAAGAIFQLFRDATSQENSALDLVLFTNFIVAIATAAAQKIIALPARWQLESDPNTLAVNG